MARKGILLNSPGVLDMSPAQWLFEYVALKKKEEAQMLMLKNVIVGTLGLNILRPEDANGCPKKFESMTEEEQNRFMPLTMWVGKDELLSRVKEQTQIEKAIEDSKSDKVYEDMVAAIDEADGDMEPILGPVPVGVETKDTTYEKQFKELVSDLSAVNSILVDAEIEDI